MKIFKKYYEFFLLSIALFFIGLIIFLFIKSINILRINFEKSLTIPKITEDSFNFNLEEAAIILRKRKLIE